MNTMMKRMTGVAVLCMTVALPLQAKVATPLNTLGAAEKNTLLMMREEEKLARDVYQTLYGVWKKPVFQNIGASEQKHMDALLKKIKLFGLVDPALPEAGRFTHPMFQTLYTQFGQWLAAKPSYTDALTIGATIEDWDINDLNGAIAATNNLALKATYQNLLEASKQHLRGFVGLLRDQGSDYHPQYMSQELFDAILDV